MRCAPAFFLSGPQLFGTTPNTFMASATRGEPTASQVFPHMVFMALAFFVAFSTAVPACSARFSDMILASRGALVIKI